MGKNSNDAAIVDAKLNGGHFHSGPINMNGEGACKWNDGTFYCGDFIDGEMTGFGYYKYKNGIYSGHLYNKENVESLSGIQPTDKTNAIQMRPAYISTTGVPVDIYLKKKGEFFFQQLPSKITLFFQRENFLQKLPYFSKDRKTKTQISTVTRAVDIY